MPRRRHRSGGYGEADTPGGLAEALPGLIAAAVLVAYANLLPAGRWQGDEYYQAWMVAHDGWRFLLDRLAGPSPRPLAELLGWAYLTLTNALDQPLTSAFLGLVWLATLLGIVLAGWAGRVRGTLLLALASFALTLLLSRPGEMFYWPMGAAAYLPCWGGLAAATLLHRADPGRRRGALTIALLVAAFSAEVGAATVLLYAALVGVAFLRRAPWRHLAPLLLPTLSAAAVCLIVLSMRMAPMHEVMDATSGLAGNWTSSLVAALPTFAREAVGIDGLPLAAGATIKLGLLLCLPAAQQPQASWVRPGDEAGAALLSVLWAGALVLGAFASVVLAYHQFGTLCCQRHAALRQGVLVLALVSVGGLLGGALRRPRLIVLSGVLAGLLAVRADALGADWQAIPQVAAARRQTWQSGLGPGDAMTLTQVRPGRIVNASSIPAGQYRRTTDTPPPPGQTPGGTPWYAWGIMARFGKHALTVSPPD